MKAACIQQRNKVVTTRMIEDFATGRQQLNNKTAEEQAEIDNALKVFCVSADKFHEVVTKTVNDEPVDGFPDEESTQIPALRRFCSDSTLVVRETKANAWLNKISMLRSSMLTWGTVLPGQGKLPAADRLAIDTTLDTKLAELQQAIAHLTLKTMEELSNVFRQNIRPGLTAAMRSADHDSAYAVREWEANHWMTYKATCSRSGTYTNKGGHQNNWNEDL